MLHPLLGGYGQVTAFLLDFFFLIQTCSIITDKAPSAFQMHSTGWDTQQSLGKVS